MEPLSCAGDGDGETDSVTVTLELRVGPRCEPVTVTEAVVHCVDDAVNDGVRVKLGELQDDIDALAREDTDALPVLGSVCVAVEETHAAALTHAVADDERQADTDAQGVTVTDGVMERAPVAVTVTLTEAVPQIVEDAAPLLLSVADTVTVAEPLARAGDADTDRDGDVLGLKLRVGPSCESVTVADAVEHCVDDAV